MSYSQCTAKVTGLHRTESGRQRCPIHRTGATPSSDWVERTSDAWSAPRRISPASRPEARRYDDQYRLIAQLSESVVDLMLSPPDGRLRDATFDLIDALTPTGDARIPRSGHVLCQLFEQVALGLQRIIDVPGAVIDELVGEEVAGSRILAACVKVLLKRAVQVAMENAMAPLVVLHLNACICALTFCPASEKHRSLEENCTMPLVRDRLSRA